jgi:glutamate-5-semialdehyde dehydrogenase
MEASEIIKSLAATAKRGGKSLISASGPQRSEALELIATELESATEEILAANSLDMQAAAASDMAPAMQDRLLLTPARISGMAEGARQVAALPDPLGRVINQRTLANGLELKQISVPFGVVGMIYEARPNVTVDAAAILLKSGNAALLRGSSSAANSNAILVEVMRRALSKSAISPEVIQLVPSDDRATVGALLVARGQVDLVIPRGSAALIRRVVDEALVPTIETGAGVCHVYFDASADAAKAIPILLNSKTQRVSVCNSAETLLIHQSRVADLLPAALQALIGAGVKIHGDELVMEKLKELGANGVVATPQDWATEYNALEMNVGVVASLDDAAEHIQQNGTSHTESIVTEDVAAANRFIALSDSAAIMVNASTRFTDGEQMGFGAEIGISNQKLHARGPMGLEAMTTTTWIVWGQGQIR